MDGCPDGCTLVQVKSLVWLVALALNTVNVPVRTYSGVVGGKSSGQWSPLLSPPPTSWSVLPRFSHTVKSTFREVVFIVSELKFFVPISS
mmetsp:Transcript_3205/g.4911  ORF Transcript_3205/g.4911 Transcript_3205/m.4911 type:complete len:90 (+) Transcript_3205:53-322(+)